MKLVLVGHGSIGSRYKKSLLERGIGIESLIVIDNKISILSKLKERN